MNKLICVLSMMLVAVSAVYISRVPHVAYPSVYPSVGYSSVYTRRNQEQAEPMNHHEAPAAMMESTDPEARTLYHGPAVGFSSYTSSRYVH